MAAEIAAASSGSPATGGFIMFAFGLGTMPLLFGFGTASSLIPQGWKQRLTVALAFVVLAMGLVFMNRSAMLMGFPVNSHSIQALIMGNPDPHVQPTPEYAAGDDGVVEVDLTVTSSGFQPANLQIPSDQPVRLIVTRIGSDVCSEQLFFPNLGIKQDLAPDSVTVVDLPATGSGSYTMTCGMGMFAGQLLAGAVPAGFGLPSWYWLTVGFAAVAAAFWLAAGIKPRVRPAPQPALAFAGAATAAVPARQKAGSKAGAAGRTTASARVKKTSDRPAAAHAHGKSSSRKRTLATAPTSDEAGAVASADAVQALPWSAAENGDDPPRNGASASTRSAARKSTPASTKTAAPRGTSASAKNALRKGTTAGVRSTAGKMAGEATNSTSSDPVAGEAGREAEAMRQNSPKTTSKTASKTASKKTAKKSKGSKK
jgi:hypothetical protein